MQAVQQAARAALENPRLAGEPEIRDTGAAEPQADQASAGFNMGSAVPVAEPEWSAAHRHVARISTWRLRAMRRAAEYQ